VAGLASVSPRSGSAGCWCSYSWPVDALTWRPLAPVSRDAHSSRLCSLADALPRGRLSRLGLCLAGLGERHRSQTRVNNPCSSGQRLLRQYLSLGLSRRVPLGSCSYRAAGDVCWRRCRCPLRCFLSCVSLGHRRYGTCRTAGLPQDNTSWMPQRVDRSPFLTGSLAFPALGIFWAVAVWGPRR